MILDEIRQAFNTGTYQSTIDKSGLSYTRVYGIRNGKPFLFDRGLVKAIENLGYEIILKENGKGTVTAPTRKKKLDLDEQAKFCRENHMTYGQMQAANFVAGLTVRARANTK